MKIFIVDNNLVTATTILNQLIEEGHEVFKYNTAYKFLEQVKLNTPDIIILNEKLSDIKKQQLLKEVKNLNQEIYVVFSLKDSFNSNRMQYDFSNIYDFFNKENRTYKLQIILKHIQRLKELKCQNAKLKNNLKQKYKFSSYIKLLPKNTDILNKLKKSIQTLNSTLIIGEKGTEKDLLANIIHYNTTFYLKSILSLNCIKYNKKNNNSKLHLNHTNFNNELIQKIKTIKINNGGTFYINNIDNLSLKFQSSLLKFLYQEINSTKNINIKIISSSKSNLTKLIDKDLFLKDLYEFINKITIELPPLRKRQEDIEILIKYFITEFSKNKTLKIENNVYDLLKEYHFPGNIAELKNLVEYFIISNADNNIISKELIPLNIIFEILNLKYFKSTSIS